MKNYFKFTSIGAVLVVAGILIAMTVPRKAGAQGPNRVSAACAILSLEYNYNPQAHITSVTVDHAELSANLAPIPHGTSAAQAVADLKAQGLRVDFATSLDVMLSSP